MYKKFIILLYAICLSFLIAYPRIATESLSATLLLWYSTVIPALYPSMILVDLILKTIPETRHPIAVSVALGLLCGFPIGCFSICNYVSLRQISKEKGQLLCAACNQFSPVFLSGYVAGNILNIKISTLFILFYGIQCIPYVTYYGILCKKPSKITTMNPKTTSCQMNHTMSLATMVDAAIVQSSGTMVKIGSYMILCGLVQTALGLLVKNTGFTVMIAALLETTNGLAYISNTLVQPVLKIPFAIFTLSFGGICGTLQVSSQLKNCGLSILKYLLHKLVVAIFSGTVTYLILA